MSSNNSTTAFQGFSVAQAYLGAPLQWLPAMGTAELDELIHAFLPGPSSIQDKRAHISMDFFEYSRQTGETFKFYPVPASFAATTANSPTTSSLYDSGYNSTFNTSPVASNPSPWTQQSPASFTSQSVRSERTQSQSQSSTSKKSSASSSRHVTTDFSGHPGMRIMTRDGIDVTNTASRGCKTKEQRDHAHLMRIIKACDSCKKKKIRCDPSHKKRTSSSASAAPPPPESKSAKKAKKKSDCQPPPTATTPLAHSDMFSFPVEFNINMTDLGAFQPAPDNEFNWDEFLDYDQDQFAQVTDFNLPVGLPNGVLQDYDFLQTPQNFTPSLGSASSASPSQVFSPFTPPQPAVFAGDADLTDGKVTSDEVILPSTAPRLPYLNPGESHGTNYVDFNLYSPASDFLDDEPQSVQALPPQPLPHRENHNPVVTTGGDGLGDIGLYLTTTPPTTSMTRTSSDGLRYGDLSDGSLHASPSSPQLGGVALVPALATLSSLIRVSRVAQLLRTPLSQAHQHGLAVSSPSPSPSVPCDPSDELVPLGDMSREVPTQDVLREALSSDFSSRRRKKEADHNRQGDGADAQSLTDTDTQKALETLTKDFAHQLRRLRQGKASVRNVVVSQEQQQRLEMALNSLSASAAGLSGATTAKSTATVTAKAAIRTPSTQTIVQHVATPAPSTNPVPQHSEQSRATTQLGGACQQESAAATATGIHFVRWGDALATADTLGYRSTFSASSASLLDAASQGEMSMSPSSQLGVVGAISCLLVLVVWSHLFGKALEQLATVFLLVSPWFLSAFNQSAATKPGFLGNTAKSIARLGASGRTMWSECWSSGVNMGCTWNRMFERVGTLVPSLGSGDASRLMINL